MTYLNLHFDVGSGFSFSFNWFGKEVYVGVRKLYRHSEGKHDLRWRLFKTTWVSHNKKKDWSWP